MAEVIPFQPGVPHQRLECTLAGLTNLFEARWNTRDAAWYLNVMEVDETPIAMGLKIVLGVEMGRACTHPFFRGRGLVALDLSRSLREATLDDLGKRVLVIYFTELDKFLAQAPELEIPR